MLQENLEYGSPVSEDGGRMVDVSIFASGDRRRREIAEDCSASGLYVRGHADLSQLVAMSRFGGYAALGDVVVVDCLDADGAMLAALSRLDMEAARAGRRVVVATTLHSLDDVFGCFDQSASHFLVQPLRVDRMMLLARVRASASQSAVREMGHDDRLALMRLSEQIERMAQSMAGWERSGGPNDGAVGVAANPVHLAASEAQPIRRTRTPLPDPRLVRAVLRQRQRRAELFGADLFADPAWDMLLDLTAARAEHRRVSVTSLCIASGVPATTALRWIGQLVEAGLFERVKDPDDARRAFIALTDRSAEAMAGYFAELAPAEALAA